MTALPPTNDDREIWDCWLSQYRLPVVTAADDAGLFVAIAGEALSTEALAAKIGAEARALSIHLAMLAGTGFVERRAGLWRATNLARTWLHPEGAGYYGPMLGAYKQSNPLHSQLLETLRSGHQATAHSSAANEWERGAMPPEMARFVTAFMNSHSIAAANGLARMPVFGGVRSMLDVGGGSAIFPITLARALPQFRGTVMEIDVVCDAAQVYIDKADVGDRVKTQAVNMFTQDWPTGHDAHFLSNIFHDWSAQTNALLAAKSFAALPSGGRIFLHEMLIDDDGCGPWQVAAFSLLMLLGTKGKQYSFVELKALLEGAGFVDVESCRTGGAYYSLVSARKA